MADDEENAEEPEAEAESDEDEDGEEGGGKKKKKKGGLKTLLLFGALPALVLIMGGAAAAMFLLGGGAEKEVAEAGEHGEASADGHGDGHAAAGEHGGVAENVVFYELPEILVNIQAEDGRASYLKLRLTLEVDSEETVHLIEPAMPRVMDRFQSFLRELRVEDLNGSLGSYRLRLELLRRVNLAVAPAEVGAVLIEEMLIQ